MGNKEVLELCQEPAVYLALDYLLDPSTFGNFKTPSQVVSYANRHLQRARKNFEDLYRGCVDRRLFALFSNFDRGIKYYQTVPLPTRNVETALIFPSYEHALLNKSNSSFGLCVDDLSPDHYSQFKKNGFFNAEYASRGVYSLYKSAFALSRGFSVFATLRKNDAVSRLKMFSSIDGLNKL